MFDVNLLVERLKTVLTALERIPRRFAGIIHPSEFLNSDAGIDRMDAICMILVAAGEEFKKIDRRTEGKLFARYPQVQWRGAIGLRQLACGMCWRMGISMWMPSSSIRFAWNAFRR